MPLITTEYVVWECVNYWSKPITRSKAHQLVDYLADEAACELIPASLLLTASGEEELALSIDRLDTLRSHASQYGVAGAVRALRALTDVQQHLDEHASPTLALEVMLLELPR